MSYYFSRIVAMPFSTAIDHVTDKLASKGFGVLTSIDVQQTMLGPGKVEVAAVDPVASMGAIGNHELEQVANDVRRLLEELVREL